ncbi:serine hydrolase, partial [Nonomuraea sp. NPDC004702]
MCPRSPQRSEDSSWPPWRGPVRRLGELPLMYQPGEQWQYQISSDLVGVLVSRVTGRPFEE